MQNPYQDKNFVGHETSTAIRKIAVALDAWAEYIRVDPQDLINNEPYNTIIFQPPVRFIGFTYLTFI